MMRFLSLTLKITFDSQSRVELHTNFCQSAHQCTNFFSDRKCCPQATKNSISMPVTQLSLINKSRSRVLKVRADATKTRLTINVPFSSPALSHPICFIPQSSCCISIRKSNVGCRSLVSVHHSFSYPFP